MSKGKSKKKHAAEAAVEVANVPDYSNSGTNGWDSSPNNDQSQFDAVDYAVSEPVVEVHPCTEALATAELDVEPLSVEPAAEVEAEPSLVGAAVEVAVEPSLIYDVFQEPVAKVEVEPSPVEAATDVEVEPSPVEAATNVEVEPPSVAVAAEIEPVANVEATPPLAPLSDLQAKVNELKAQLAALAVEHPIVNSVQAAAPPKKSGAGSKPRSNVTYFLLKKPTAWANTPQQSAIEKILFSDEVQSRFKREDGQVTLTEAEIFSVIEAGAAAGMLRTGQPPVRVFNYYYPKLLSAGCIRKQ